MRILAVYHATLTPDGKAIFRALAALEDVELTVIAPARVSVNPVYDPSGYLALDSEQMLDGYKLIPCALTDPKNYISGYNTGELFKLIDTIKPDVIHVFDEAFSVAVAQVSTYARKARIPLLFYAFENMPLACGVRSRLRYWSAWRGVSGGGAANSEAVQRLHEVGFSKDKPIDLIPWGIDTQICKPVSGAGVRKTLGEDAKFVVGFVGRLAEEKGINVLLDAIRTLPSSVHAMIIGAGPLESSLQELAENGDLAGRIHLFPVQPASDIAKYYCAMDILAVPSMQTKLWKEQFGRVIVEAMACGTPVIGSSSGAIPEVIGDAGVVTLEGDSSALAEAIKSLMANDAERSRLSKIGIVKSQTNYSAEAMANRLAELYRKVVVKA